MRARSMVSEILKKMLVLQDRDMKLQQVEGLLVSVPLERQACQARIEELKAKIEGTRLRVKELEARSKGIESEMASIEAQVIKYKNQQLQVKKNEEYQALTHEIGAAGERISALESQELETLYELDEAKKQQVEDEKAFAERIEREKQSIARLDEQEAQLKGQLEGARSAQADAEAELDNPSRSKYRQVARGLKFPVVVELVDRTCRGCHMRVSNAVDSEVRAGSEITTCDSCGRILYSSF